MRKNLFLMAFAAMMITISAQAQIKQPAGMRMEVAEADIDNSEYSIFTYKDTDSDDTFAYYLSLGRVTQLLGAIRDDITDMSFDDIRETCVFLGATYDETITTLNSILDLYDKDLETTVEFRGRAATGSDRLGEPNVTLCMVKKKPLGGKRLEFFFDCGNRHAHAYLPKSVVKNLRTDLKIDKKLHPKLHR